MAEIASFGVNVDQNTRLAQNAQDTADEANKKNSANSQQIANINDPNYLTPFEKPQLEIQMDNFATIYTADKDIATSEGIDFTAYDAAYQAYVAYMTPLVADMTTYSPIVRATFNSMVTAVQAEQKHFNAATQAQYNQQINKAQTDISDGQTKYKALQSDAETMKSSVAGIADAADRAISNAGFASNVASTASQAASSALASAMSAESSASSAVSTANSTASEFAPVKQSADSAFAGALSAQSDASSAVSQASSAAADSKDAKQIAGAVSQSYKTLTDGSTMTIAELESGLAVKLTKTDLNGYATQDWSNNQIKITSDGINGTISSVKNTVDSHTTSINTLQTDSNGFKDQFTTVNNTIGKHTTDIGTLQASAKSLSASFDSLNTDNNTNKHDISQLQATSSSFSSTLETVQTQVQDSAVGTNLLVGTSTPVSITGTNSSNQVAYNHALAGGMSAYNLYQKYGSTFTLSYDWSVTDTANTYAGTMQQQFNNVPWKIRDNNTISSSNKSGHKVITLTLANNSANIATGLEFRLDYVPTTSKITVSNMKLEKGSLATDWCANPADNATVTALTQVKQTAEGAQALATNNHGDITSLQETAKGIQTTVSDNYSYLKSQNTQTAGLVQTLVGKSPSNIIKDGGFNSAVVGQIPSGWNFSSTAQIAANPNETNGLVALDHPVLQINSKTSGNSDIYYGDWFDVQPGDQFYAELKARWSSMSQKGQIRLGVNTKDATGKWAWNSAVSIGSPSNWTKYTGVLTIPAGAVQGRVWVAWQDSAADDEAVFVTDLVVRPAYATQADITVLSNDINLRVKKGDVVNQFNIDAGGALLQTVGGNTKIVLSAPNVIVDSANPMQIQNANIVGTLTGKTFEAGTITATTKIISSDIEASLIHSKDNSFSLNGATGDIVGPSIHAADNSWGISNAGKIHGTSITASVMDISGDGKGPNFDAVNVTPDTTQGIYSRYKYSVNSGYDVSKFGRTLYKNGYLVINGDTFLNRTIGDWSADGGGKYVYDTMYEAHTIKMRAYNYTGSNVQTDDPSLTKGSISSRLDIQPSAITMGRDWSVGNPNILIDGDGLLKVGSIAINGHHSMGTTDGSDMYFMKMNKNATDVSGTSIPIHAARYYTANMGISGGHVINSYDGGDVYLEDKWGSGGNTVSLHVKKLYNSSLLSLKTDITTIDPNDALETIANTDFRSYRFKTDDPSEPKSVSPILDDENQIPKYNTPNIFKSADGKSRNDGNILGYTALSVQALYAKIKDLTARLQKLEGVN